MINKKYFKLMGILIMVSILFFGVGLIRSIENELIIYEGFPGLLVQGQNVATKGFDDNGHITFTFGKEATLNVNGVLFERIVPKNNLGFDNSITFGRDGIPIKGSWQVTEGESVTYSIGKNEELVVPGGTKISFTGKPGIIIDGEQVKIIKLELTKGAILESDPNLKNYLVEVKCFDGCFLPNGAMITGIVSYYGGGPFINPKSGTPNINGIQLTPEKSTRLFFDIAQLDKFRKDSPDNPYVYFGSDGIFEAKGNLDITANGLTYNLEENGGVKIAERPFIDVPLISGEPVNDLLDITVTGHFNLKVIGESTVLGISVGENGNVIFKSSERRSTTEFSKYKKINLKVGGNDLVGGNEINIVVFPGSFLVITPGPEGIPIIKWYSKTNEQYALTEVADLQAAR